MICKNSTRFQSRRLINANRNFPCFEVFKLVGKKQS